jgi:hypothetical protein
MLEVNLQTFNFASKILLSSISFCNETWIIMASLSSTEKDISAEAKQGSV